LLLLAPCHGVPAVAARIRPTPQAAAGAAAAGEPRGLLQTSWLIMVVFWVGWAAGDTVATVLFALVAFFALREFITLSPTRRGDHRSLVLAFFVVLPCSSGWWAPAFRPVHRVHPGLCVPGDARW
jgi:predicted CDP-diglyceride synthetase/phosphatidate cytidylyltransferase